MAEDNNREALIKPQLDQFVDVVVEEEDTDDGI